MRNFEMEKNKPNLLFIKSDQHNFRYMSHRGNTEAETPNLDELASRGATFANVYCQKQVSSCQCLSQSHHITAKSSFTCYKQGSLPAPSVVIDMEAGDEASKMASSAVADTFNKSPSCTCGLN